MAKVVMTAGWSPAAVTTVRIALAGVLLAPAVAVVRPRALRFRRTDLWLLLGQALELTQLAGVGLMLTGAVLVQVSAPV